MKLNIVPARTGVQWVKLGLRTFRQQPFALTGLFFMFTFLMTVISLLPYIGSALVLALLPAATLGFMVAAQQASTGKFPMPWILATALRSGRKEMRAMALLGVLYALGFLGIMGLSALVDGGQFVSLYLGGGVLTRETFEQADFRAAVLLFVSLNLPLSLLFWHAPALVHWHGVPPVKALFFSFIACVRNLGAYVVFWLLWLAIFLSVVMLATSAAVLLGGEEAAPMALVPSAMLVTALFLTSLYFTFADSFVATPEASRTDEV